MEAKAQQKMPLLQNVGIIPMQWEGDALQGGTYKRMAEAVNAEFYNVAKRAARFRMLNDELVKASWMTPEGRQDLAQNYELHAYLNLTGAVSGETLRLVARLLSPELKTILVQTEAMPVMKLANASSDELSDVLRNLIFGLLNRLPIDVSVTSVQGSYVSLSGGSRQNLRVGDEVDIKRPTITTLHPADGSWLNFSTAIQGKAKIVDLKPQTAVALISSQSYDGAIAVGDGLKVSDIPGRKFFIKDVSQPAFRDTGADVVVVAPKASQAKSDDAADKRPQPENRPFKPNSENEPLAVAPKEAQKQDTPTVPPALSEDDETPPPASDAMATLPTAPGRLDYTGIDAIAGLESWSVSGGGKASSKASLLLFNYFAARVRMPYIPGWDVEALGALHYGSTKSGDYYGLTGSGKMVYPMDLGFGKDMMVRLGGEAVFETIAVNDETYGGGDYLTLGAFGGIDAMTVWFDQNIQTVLDLTLRPFAFGQAGFGGSKKSISGYTGYALRGEALLSEPKESLNWGLGVDINSFDAKAGSKKLSYSETSVYGILKTRF